MKRRMRTLAAFFRGAAKLQKSFTIEIGPVRATGIPAVLIGAGGIVLASGITAALNKSANRLPETLSEARGLAQTLSGGSPRLPS